MAIFITGDLHGRSYISKLQKFNNVYGNQLSRDDTLIILGDVCVPWHDPPDENDRKMLNLMENFPWTTVFIDGNHENHDFLSRIKPTKYGENLAQFITPHVIHLMRDRIYNIEGKSFLTMGGAHSINKAMLQNQYNWWETEAPTKIERKICDNTIEKSTGHVDYILTHTPPAKQLKEHAIATISPWKPDEYNLWLQEHIADKITFNTWFYGHMHDDRPWETKYVPLMHVIYDLDNKFKDQLWGPESLLDYWELGDPW